VLVLLQVQESNTFSCVKFITTLVII